MSEAEDLDSWSKQNIDENESSQRSQSMDQSILSQSSTFAHVFTPDSAASSSQTPPSTPESQKCSLSPDSHNSELSPPQSPVSSDHEPSSPPESPASHAQEPSSPQTPCSVNEQQSEDEVQVSSPDGSDNEISQMNTSSHKNAKFESADEEKNENTSSDREDKQENGTVNSCDNENIPKIEISDDNDRSSNHIDSEEKEIVKGDNEEIDKNEYDCNFNSSPTGTPEKSFPVLEENNQESDNEVKEDFKKVDSDDEREQNEVSDSDAESEESEVGGLIADIFGDSDDEGEFEGFGEETSTKSDKEIMKPKTEKKKRNTIISDSEEEGDEKEKEDAEEIDQGVIVDVLTPLPEEEIDDIQKEKSKKKKKVDSDSDDDRKMREDFVSDFDLMMQKKKEENSKKRRRKDVDLISDSDDLIADIIAQMRLAAEEDKELNKQKKTATKKLKILQMVMSQLKKQDLKNAFLDQGVLNVIAEWLTPLPDRSLPHLNIREGMLRVLSDFPTIDIGLLKSSGVGKALMYLFKHPKETKENKERANRLITEWSRPIFNVAIDYHSLSKEEREQRDYDHVPKRRKKGESGVHEEEQETKKDIEKELTAEQKPLKPGDKGWIGRARVPIPSTKDYVNRPKWNVETEFGRSLSKKPLSRIEKHMRSLQEKKKLNKAQRAINISIEGRKMAI